MFHQNEPHVAGVALLAEGVDRNTEREDKVAERNLSPSSRRAWIEISKGSERPSKSLVALLAEGVDRNFQRIRHGTLK